MWIALAIALGVFLVLLLIARLTNQDKQNAEATPETETVQEAETDEAAETGDGDAAQATENGDASEAAETGDGKAAQATENGDASKAAETGDGDTAEATKTGDSDTSEATENSDTSETTETGDGNAAEATETTAATDNSTSETTATDNSTSEATATDSNTATTTAQDSNAVTDTASAQSTAADAKTAVQYADIVVQDYGTITVQLDPVAAPITVQNFVDLVKDNFYNGLTFHRIMDGFMIQGGDPLGNGHGGSGKNIVGEFPNNGYAYNTLTHTRGAISMARATDMNSASSQFFIVHKDHHDLDGNYAVFGYVTSGMEVVDQICKDAEPTDNNGSIAPEKQPIIESITIREQ